MRKMKELFFILIFVLVILLIISSFGGSLTFSTPDHVVIINEPSHNDDDVYQDIEHNNMPLDKNLEVKNNMENHVVDTSIQIHTSEHIKNEQTSCSRNDDVIEGMDNVIPFFNQNKVFSMI